MSDFLDRDTVRRLLVIKLRAIGDVVLSTVVTRNLREAFPKSEIHFLTEIPAAGVLKGNPFVDSVVIYDRKTMTGLGLITAIRRKKYDLVFDLFGNPRSALVTRLSGARYRVGYRFRGRSYAYNIRVTPRGDVVHNTQFNLDALEAVGLPIVDREVPFFCPLEDEQIVAEFLSGGVAPGRLLVGMNIGAGHYVRRWGLDRFAHLADRLIERYGAEVVLPWGPGERDDVQSVQSMMKHRAFIPPPATLLQLGALLKRCTFVVSNDTGPMHIAAAVGTPVLGIHGPTNPVLQGAYGSQHMVVQKEGLECLGCNLTKCPIGHPCMLELTVDTVLKHVDSLLKKNGIAVDAAQ